MDPVVQIGRPVPDFSLSSISGVPHRLSEQEGKVVVINFWSAECPWSQRMDEPLAQLSAEWEGQVEFWSIASNVNEDEALIRDETTERQIKVVLLDPDQRVADQFGATTTPQIFVIDPDRVLRYTGAVDDRSFRNRETSQTYLADAIRAVVEDRSPDPANTPPYGCAIVRHTLSD